MRNALPLFAPVLLAATLAGCGGSSKSTPAATPTVTVVVRMVDGRCPVTRPGPELKVGDGGFNYGDESLARTLGSAVAMTLAALDRSALLSGVRSQRPPSLRHP